jgi:hypothetical protein
MPLKISRSLKFVLAEAEALLGAFRQIVVVTSLFHSLTFEGGSECFGIFHQLGC